MDAGEIISTKTASILLTFLGLNMHFIPVIRGRLKFHP